MMMTADGNDMSNWDFDYHLLPTKVETSLISSELPLFAEKPVLVASLAMAGPQSNLMVVFIFWTLQMSEKMQKLYSHRLVHIVWSHSRVKTHIFFWVPQLTLYSQQQP